MKKFFKSKKGITLISLVVTIIVLIILAGITVSTFLGDGGIINRAKEARQHYINAQAEEPEKIRDLYSQIKFAKDGTITLDAETLEEFVQDLIDDSIESNNLNKIYPVGSIYISTSSINPGTYLGGTWVSFGAGRTIVGLDSNDTNFDTVEETGGEKTHTLTVQEMPSHRHGQWYENSSGSNYPSNNHYYFHRSSIDAGSFSGWVDSSGMTDTGGSQAHNNLQPYITTYMWKRTN